MWEIRKKDFATFNDGDLTIVLLHPGFVHNIAAEELIKSEIKLERQ